MVEIIGKVSKGSRMDQVYIPKRRTDFEVGKYVIIRPLGEVIEEKTKEKPCFYNVGKLEPVKVWVIEKVFSTLGRLVQKYDNMIITGSFLDKGFNFNDIDLVLVAPGKAGARRIQSKLEKAVGVKFHIIALDNKTLMKGLKTDPLYQAMLSRCVARKRLIHKPRYEVNYRLLDLHLLKSRLLAENFDTLAGNEKYDMVRNLTAIKLFIRKKKVGKDLIDREINRNFGKDAVRKIKQNMLEKDEFLKKYGKILGKAFKDVMEGVKHAPKQEKADKAVHREHVKLCRPRHTGKGGRRREHKEKVR